MCRADGCLCGWRALLARLAGSLAVHSGCSLSPSSPTRQANQARARVSMYLALNNTVETSSWLPTPSGSLGSLQGMPCHVCITRMASSSPSASVVTPLKSPITIRKRSSRAWLPFIAVAPIYHLLLLYAFTHLGVKCLNHYMRHPVP